MSAPQPRILKTLRDVPDALRRPMTQKEVEVFFYTSAALDVQANALQLIEHADRENETALGLLILLKRLTCAESELQFSFMAVLMLAFLSRSPGDAVLWAHYLVRRSYEVGLVDMSVLTRDFPMGFPTDIGMSKIWDAQKRQDNDPEGPENSLDALWPWQRSVDAATEVSCG